LQPGSGHFMACLRPFTILPCSSSWVMAVPEYEWPHSGLESISFAREGCRQACDNAEVET
jgi:hypothetical protein